MLPWDLDSSESKSAIPLWDEEHSERDSTRTAMQMSISLLRLNETVGAVLRQELNATYWVQAEISGITDRGHCYLELIETNDQKQTIAQARATIWRDKWSLLRHKFELQTAQQLTKGLKVLLQVAVTFHSLYGYSLNVQDIDPTYTLGDMVRKRQEILNRLRIEGLLTRNKELAVPLLLQRIAVISSSTAAGYGDFCRQLTDNPYQLSFCYELFETTMQGDRTEASVLAAFSRIAQRRNDFDIVVIIRGGGAANDLSSFETYPIAATVAAFPLPVITGIGHERDNIVLDEVACFRVKTPTAAAELLIANQKTRMDELVALASYFGRRVPHILQTHKETLYYLSSSVTRRVPQHINMQREMLHEYTAYLERRIPQVLYMHKDTLRQLSEKLIYGLPQRLKTSGDHLNQLQLRLHTHVQRQLHTAHHRLELLEQQTQHSDPKKLLQRGYSMLLKDGKIITSVKQLKNGDTLQTQLKDGQLIATVQTITTENQKDT